MAIKYDHTEPPAVARYARGKVRTGFVVHARPTPWCAFHDGEEENPHHYGWGASESEALADLARLDQERAECEAEERTRRWIAELEDC